MIRVFDSSLLDSIGNVLTERTGLRIDQDKRVALENGVRASCGELGFSDPIDCAKWLASSNPTPAQIRVLASHLTVGETYFFREKTSFQALEERILPELIAKRRGRDQRLRIWSAGCCTGEEPYSITISLDKILPDSKEWDITLLATDINPHFLKKAKEAVYGEWSFRDHSDALLESYFTRTRARLYRLIPRLRKRVTFAPLNLAEDIYPSPMNGTVEMDVIVCRNVLMYLKDDCAARVVRNLGRCLADGGWLLVGGAEGSLAREAGLAPANLPGVTAFRKQTAELARHEIPAPTVKPAAEISPARRTPIVHKSTADERPRAAEVVNAALPHDGNGPVNSLESLAREHANQGDLARALACCEKLIAIEKLNPRIRYLHAMILQEQGDLAQAAVSFRRTIYLDPDFIMAHVGAGHLALRLGNHKEADQHLRRATRLLKRLDPKKVVPESDGLDAHHLAELIAREEKGTPQ